VKHGGGVVKKKQRNGTVGKRAPLQEGYKKKKKWKGETETEKKGEKKKRGHKRTRGQIKSGTEGIKSHELRRGGGGNGRTKGKTRPTRVTEKTKEHKKAPLSQMCYMARGALLS